MAREWTDEQRAVASQRAKAQGLGKKASVEEVDLDARRATVDSAEVFLAKNEGAMIESVDTVKGEDGTPVTTTHKRAGTLTMYKPTETQGYAPRTVSSTAIRMLLKQGWAEHCPECNGEHLDKNGTPSSDPNLCKARPSVKVRVCRVCQKRIYDNVRFSEEVVGAEDDPNVIVDDTYDVSTPESRTTIMLNLHYWLRHPRQAQMMGVAPMQGALAEMVAENKVV